MSRMHVRGWTFLVVTTLFFISAGCSTKTVSDNDVIATWGDTTVTVENFKARMYTRHRNEPTAMKQTFEERMDVLVDYVTRDLKLAEGRRLGFDKREDIVKQGKESIERKAIDLLYNKRVRDMLFTDEEILEFWKHDREEVRVRHILFELPEDLEDKDTLQYWSKANEVHEKAASGETFTKLVDRYSDDRSIEKKLHGDLGFFKWGKMVDEFQDAAWDLKKGEISPVVRTRFGYHIIKLIERRSRGLQYNTSHILVKCSRKADPAETTAAYERAVMILKEAQKKGADFAQLARSYSEDDKTWVNGSVGYIPRGSMPSDYWDAVYTMENGQIIGPIKTYKGCHIIKLEDSREEVLNLSNEKVKERVLASMSRVNRELIKNRAEFFLDSVMDAFEMKYNEDVVRLLLRKLNDDSTPSNMNRFTTFTLEERDLKVVSDKVGGISIFDLVNQYGDNALPPQYRKDREFVVEMVDPIIIPKYLSFLAEKEGLFDHPATVDDAKRSVDNTILTEIEKEMIFNKAAPTEDDIKDYYDRNLEEFTDPAKVTVIEIQVDDKQFAEDLYGRVKKGEDITKLARRYTQRKRSKRKGGELGPFTRDKYGKMSEIAFSLDVGEYGGPVLYNGSYSIIRLQEKIAKNVKSLTSSRDKIQSDLRFSRQKNIKIAWVEQLKKYYHLKIDESVVKSVWPLIEALPEPMVEQRKAWRDERNEIGKRGKIRRKAENELKVKLRPGSTQTFERDGKRYEVNIGEPRPAGKGGKGQKITSSNPQIKLSPKGKKGSNSKPSIKIRPKSGGGK